MLKPMIAGQARSLTAPEQALAATWGFKTMLMLLLVVVGEEDVACGALDGERLREAIPGARLEYVARAGHTMTVERPEETLLAVQYGAGTLTLVLPNQPLPQGRTAATMLVDLARRVLPTMAGAAAPPAVSSSPTPAPPPGPVRALR